MDEKMDDRTAIWRNDGVSTAAIFIKGLDHIAEVPEEWLKWHQAEDDGGIWLTIGEIREQCREHVGGTLYVWVEGPMSGEIYQTGNYPDETCWRRHGITGGYA